MRLIYFLSLVLAACSAQNASTRFCADITRGCEVEINHARAMVKTNVNPQPLRPFALEIHLPQAQQVAVELTMRDMNMGSNLYPLQRDAQGIWRGRVILPVCVSGRRDWVMTVIADGGRGEIAFQSEAN